MSIAILLAAGKGTRMRSTLPKPIVPFQGKPIVAHLIDSFKQAGIQDIYLIVGHGAEEVKQTIGRGVHYVYQKTQHGTADAVQHVRYARRWTNEDVFVFVGDSPLIAAETIKRLEAHHRDTNASCTFLTALFPIDLPYARVLKNEQGELLGCVEEKNATAEQLLVRELLSSHFIFKARELFGYLDEIKPDKDNREYYLTDIIGIFLKHELKVETLLIDNYKELVGLNTPEDIQWAEDTLHS
ncbi:MAG: glmU [Chitinophagaceae bacterium]|nr:glmU [Chitinophagaceae bacterium]